MENKSIGFTIGKFAPLHKGHQLLIETAIKEKTNAKKIFMEAQKYAIGFYKKFGFDSNEAQRLKIMYQVK